MFPNLVSHNQNEYKEIITETHFNEKQSIQEKVCCLQTITHKLLLTNNKHSILTNNDRNR